MKALSIKQPWASLIVSGVPLTERIDLGGGRSTVKLSEKVLLKNIENRNWPTAYRGRIVIHAGQRFDAHLPTFKFLVECIGLAPMTAMILFSPAIVPLGGLIGEVDLVDCVDHSDNPWFTGPYGFILSKPVAYAKPIPYKGRLGLFEVLL